MPDPIDPIDPVEPPSPSPPPPPVGPGYTRPTSTGLPSNVAAMLACFPLIGGIIFYILEQRDSFVRFYAMQSIIFGAAWVLFEIVYGICLRIVTPIPVLGSILGALLWIVWALGTIAFVIVLVIAIVKAFSGVRWDIPWVGPLARKQTGETL
jgi:uncharacterized membrane protein